MEVISLCTLRRRISSMRPQISHRLYKTFILPPSFSRFSDIGICYCSKLKMSNNTINPRLSSSFFTSHGAFSSDIEKLIEQRQVNLPECIKERLNTLRHEIIESLVGESSIIMQLNDATRSSASSFTKSLEEMAKYYFCQEGKLLRPTVALLMARACNQLKPVTKAAESGRETVTANQYKIALISEMIHTASLVHDDVIDEANIRRGMPTINALWGNKMAVLVGDFILARATQVLCSIGRPSVISVMSTIIEDLVKGEFMQMTSGGDLSLQERFVKYLAKNYSKTASLFANSCRSAAMLSDVDESNHTLAFEYGRSIGLSFQIIDDLLDFLSPTSTMGKETAIDLKLGLATAPVLFASEEYPELNALISRQFSKDNDVNLAWNMVANSSALQKTRSMAQEYAYNAVKFANHFPNEHGIRDQLIHIALNQLERNR